MSPAGLRFQCVKGCTNCCEVTGWVYLSANDLVRAAAFMGMPVAEFEQRYVYRTRHLIRLRKPRGAQCHFLRNGGCSIHPAKPTQCRAYPFWPELVENRKAWEREGKRCPGIGRGRLVQIGTALERAHEMREAYPAIYGPESERGL